MASIERRIGRLEGRLEPPEGAEESKWGPTRQEHAERLNELAKLYQREGETIKNRMALFQELGHSERDARTLAKDEVLRAKNPELWDWLNQSFPPELRHDPVAKYRWLGEHLESRRAGRFTRA